MERIQVVLKSYFEVTSTSDRSATESWQIPGESSWVMKKREKVNLLRSSTMSMLMATDRQTKEK